MNFPQAVPTKRTAALIGAPSNIARVYAQGRREHLESQLEMFPHIVSGENFEALLPQLREIELFFSTWGMLPLSGAQLEQLPRLKAVFYAAGTVQSFARPFLERGILVVSAWAANAVPVAQWTAAQILLSNKGYWRNSREFTRSRAKGGVWQGRGNFGATVCLLGAGQIGRLVVEFLRPFDLKICVFDPFLPDETAAELGVEKVGLREAFERGVVVSNHLANLPATVGMIGGEHFSAMPDGATFINTGRGATVRETELIEIFAARPDLTALLDVTHPEPPTPDSPLWTLENVHLSSHIAGSIGDEVVRMADYVIEECERWQNGQPLRYAVTLEMLETMA